MDCTENEPMSDRVDRNRSPNEPRDSGDRAHENDVRRSVELTGMTPTNGSRRTTHQTPGRGGQVNDHVLIENRRLLDSTREKRIAFHPEGPNHVQLRYQRERSAEAQDTAALQLHI